MANCSGSVSSQTFALEEEEDSGQAGEDILEDAPEVSLVRPKFLFVRRYWAWASGGSCPGSVCGLAPRPYHLSSTPHTTYNVAFKYFKEQDLEKQGLVTFHISQAILNR